MLFTVLILIACLVGHLGIWCAIFNQMHATAWPRPTRKVTEKAIYGCVIFGLIAISWFVLATNVWSIQPTMGRSALQIYCWLCLLAACFFSVRWLQRHWQPRCTALISRQTNIVRCDRARGVQWMHGWQANLLGAIPGNQSLDLSVEHDVIAVPDLPEPLQGLKIAHFSDLHFTGKVDVEFFRGVVREINRLNADFVCLTGDIVDYHRCLPWLEQTLCQVSAKTARLFILGNHDRRIRDARQIREPLTHCGWVDASAGWHSFTHGGQSICFAGNELPWFRLADEIVASQPGGFPVLLSHSPDQFGWARQQGFPLMLAGHTHGGQIRFPLIGPVIAPSRHGVKYASGLFEQGHTVMHVSRGISGDDPIRLNCPPELTLLELAARRRP